MELLEKIGRMTLLEGLGMLIIAGSISYGLYLSWGNYQIKRNMEPNSVFFEQGERWYGRFRNIDLDGNGKYESIFTYKNSRGERVYQEIVRGPNGKLTFLEPKPFN